MDDQDVAGEALQQDLELGGQGRRRLQLPQQQAVDADRLGQDGTVGQTSSRKALCATARPPTTRSPPAATMASVAGSSPVSSRSSTVWVAARQGRSPAGSGADRKARTGPGRSGPGQGPGGLAGMSPAAARARSSDQVRPLGDPDAVLGCAAAGGRP